MGLGFRVGMGPLKVGVNKNGVSSWASVGAGGLYASKSLSGGKRGKAKGSPVSEYTAPKYTGTHLMDLLSEILMEDERVLGYNTAGKKGIVCWTTYRLMIIQDGVFKMLPMEGDIYGETSDGTFYVHGKWTTIYYEVMPDSEEVSEHWEALESGRTSLKFEFGVKPDPLDSQAEEVFKRYMEIISTQNMAPPTPGTMVYSPGPDDPVAL